MNENNKIDWRIAIIAAILTAAIYIYVGQFK